MLIHFNMCKSDQNNAASQAASLRCKMKSLSVCAHTHTHMQIHNICTHIFRRGVAGVRVLIPLKNGNCISLADLGPGAKSLKLQLVSHNPLPSQQLSKSLGRWQGVMGVERRRSEWRWVGRQKKVRGVRKDVGLERDAQKHRE